MELNSRALALLVGFSVSCITTAFLSLMPGVSYAALIVVAILAFSSTYILVRLVAEFLFFKEIDMIYEALRQLKSDDLLGLSTKNKSYFNPLRKINREISQFAEKKQEEIDQLKKMETFRREFVADVSHELKTPIFAAQGFVHTLLDGAVEDKKVRYKFLKKAAKSLDGLDALVQDLLTISQMEIGEIKMHFEHFDVVDMCREVFDQLEVKAEKKAIVLKFDKNYPTPIYVYGDYHRMYQVLTNLITNGIKYTKMGGFVEVKFEITQNGKRVQIMVEDNGRGIPKEDQARIFERFYRVDKSRSKERGGTGLGLSIVKHILEAHKTQIEVESEVDKGSKFWFKLEVGKPDHAKTDRRGSDTEED